MKQLAMLMVAVAFCLGADAEVHAQVPYVTYYQPVTVYRPPVYSPPVVYAPRTVYYAPAPAPPAVAYQPTSRVVTRYRPFLGGTVSRVRYGYTPTYYAPAPVVYGY